MSLSVIAHKKVWREIKRNIILTQFNIAVFYALYLLNIQNVMFTTVISLKTNKRFTFWYKSTFHPCYFQISWPGLQSTSHCEIGPWSVNQCHNNELRYLKDNLQDCTWDELQVTVCRLNAVWDCFWLNLIAPDARSRYQSAHCRGWYCGNGTYKSKLKNLWKDFCLNLPWIFVWVIGFMETILKCKYV